MCPFCDKRGPPRVGWAAKQQELLPHWAEIKHKKHVNKICLNFVGFRGSGKILRSALCSTRAQTQEATCSNTPHGDGLPKHSCSTELSLKYLLIAALLRGKCLYLHLLFNYMHHILLFPPTEFTHILHTYHWEKPIFTLNEENRINRVAGAPPVDVTPWNSDMFALIVSQ